MPAAKTPEFRRRALDLVEAGDLSPIEVETLHTTANQAA